jgi:hypothetical protein
MRNILTSRIVVFLTISSSAVAHAVTGSQTQKKKTGFIGIVQWLLRIAAKRTHRLIMPFQRLHGRV